MKLDNVAKILQEKNVIVKIHPRDNRTIYKKKIILKF